MSNPDLHSRRQNIPCAIDVHRPHFGPLAAGINERRAMYDVRAASHAARESLGGVANVALDQLALELLEKPSVRATAV
jgi:hypothetical protein